MKNFGIKAVMLKTAMALVLFILVISLYGLSRRESAIRTIPENPAILQTQTNTFDSFLISTFGMGYNSMTQQGEPWRWEVQGPIIRDSLKLNSYTFHVGGGAYPYDGFLDDPISGYSGNVISFMEAMKNTYRIQYGNYGRGTFNALCGAQRSTYEAEDNQKYGFYNNISPVGEIYSNDQYGAGGRCALKTGSSQPGYLISGLIENAEQSDNYISCGAGSMDDSAWIVKPRMRIDSASAYQFYDSVIARVEIYRFDG